MRNYSFLFSIVGALGLQPLSAATIEFELTGTVSSTYSIPDTVEADFAPPQIGDAFSFVFQFDTDAPLIEFFDWVWPEEGLFDDYAYYETMSVTGTQNGAPIQSTSDDPFTRAQLFVADDGNWSGPLLDGDNTSLGFDAYGLYSDIYSEGYAGDPDLRNLPLGQILEGFELDETSTVVSDTRSYIAFDDIQRFTLDNLTLTSSLLDDIAPAEPIAPTPIPLPASAILLLAGLGALRFARKG